jgi:hypothetical protein
MLLVLLAVAVGLALAFVAPVDVAADRSARAADALVAHAGHRILSVLPASMAHNRAGPPIVALVALATPGVLSWICVGLAGASGTLRRVIFVFAVVAAVGGFVLLPVGEAVVLTIALAVFAFVVGIATRLVLTLPLAALAVAIGVRQVVRVVGDRASDLRAAASELARLTPLPFTLWHVVAIVVALLPLVGTALGLRRVARRA